MQKALPAACSCRWLPVGRRRLLRPHQHQAGPVQHAAAALGGHDAAALSARHHVAAAVNTDEASAAAAAAAASQAGPDAAFPAGLSRSAVSSAFR